MLVLTRKPGESLLLDTGHEFIVVAVVAIRGDKVRIGIEAPYTTNVVRSELQDRTFEDSRDANG